MYAKHRTIVLCGLITMVGIVGCDESEGVEWAQNECPGWPSVDDVIQGCLQSMWNEGPGEPYSEHGHYINMTSESYTKVACGFYETPAATIWAVQNFQ